MNSVARRADLPDGRSLEIVQGDITEEQVDAIINAANEHLAHGGGVAGIISRKGGPRIQAESDAWVRQHGPVSHSQPAYTSGGNLPSRYVIHAVGPIWGQGDEDRKLADAVRGSLELAEQLGLESLAMPAISTGIYGFPKERAARIILKTILDSLKTGQFAHLRRIRLVLYDTPTVEIFSGEFDRVQVGHVGLPPGIEP